MTEDLIAFLIDAKRSTYAARGDEYAVPPLLRDSKQLEYRSGSFFYRDIYFGLTCFVGQETVSLDEKPIWSMAYSGGVAPQITERADVRAIYAFLRQALRLVDRQRPFRGPSTFETDGFRYTDGSEGALSAFHGSERIDRLGQQVYELRYSGGAIR